MKEVRAKLSTDDLKQEWHNLVEMPVYMLNCQMRRLSLKERQFNSFLPAEDANINKLWENCLKIEEKLDVGRLPWHDIVYFHFTCLGTKKFLHLLPS